LDAVYALAGVVSLSNHYCHVEHKVLVHF
jgi:hypothetical protein